MLAGGRVPDLPGFYYEPTVLDQVSGAMPVLTEEVFGPAVPLIRAADTVLSRGAFIPAMKAVLGDATDCEAWLRVIRQGEKP